MGIISVVIVTRFDVQAFDQGEMWGGKVFYLEHVYTRQIQALVEYLNADQLDIKIHICLSIGYEALIGSTLCMNDIFCLSPEKPASLEPFASVESSINQMCTLRTGYMKSFADEAYIGAAANR